MRTKIFLLVAVLFAACSINAEEFKEIELSFGDTRNDNDWSLYINGERLSGTLDEALKSLEKVKILSVVVEVSPRFPHSRGTLNEHDLFEDPKAGDRYLIKQGEARKLRFVRAPVTRTEAWDKIKKYIIAEDLDMERRYLNSIQFYSKPDSNLYRWWFDYRLKNADGGGIYIFYNLLTDEITHMSVY